MLTIHPKFVHRDKAGTKWQFLGLYLRVDRIKILFKFGRCADTRVYLFSYREQKRLDGILQQVNSNGKRDIVA